jgi:hypothetical protein
MPWLLVQGLELIRINRYSMRTQNLPARLMRKSWRKVWKPGVTLR